MLLYCLAWQRQPLLSWVIADLGSVVEVKAVLTLFWNPWISEVGAFTAKMGRISTLDPALGFQSQ